MLMKFANFQYHELSLIVTFYWKTSTTLYTTVELGIANLSYKEPEF